MMSLVRAQLGEPKKTSNHLVARFFRFFPLYISGLEGERKENSPVDCF